MTPSPDRAARLLPTLGLACFAGSLAGRVLDPLVGVLAGDFAAEPATIALLSTAFALPYALVQPVLGPVGDAMGKRRVVLAGLGLLALALAAGALAQGLAALFTLRMLAGAAAGGIFPLCIAIIGDRVPLEGRQVALSRLVVAALTGQVLGGAMAGFLEPWLGWRGVLLACAAVALAALAVLRAGGVAPDGPPARPSLSEALVRYRGILRIAAARRLFLAVFLEAALVFGAFPFFVPLLEARGAGGTAEAGMAVAGFGLGGFVFVGLAPWLVRRLGRPRMMQAGGAGLGLALGALAAAPGALAFAACCIAMGVGFYALHTSIQTGVTEVAPTARGSAVALHAFAFFLGQSLGPALFGLGMGALGAGAMLVASGFGMVALGAWIGGHAVRDSPRGANGG